MSAIELYEKTLEQYKAQLRHGRNVSLTVFCKEHHVNGRAMNKWMGSHGIYVHALRKELLPAEAARRPQDRPSKLFAEILPPSMSNPTNPENLADVRIEMPGGIKVAIGSCDAFALGLVLSHLKNDGEPCSH